MRTCTFLFLFILNFSLTGQYVEFAGKVVDSESKLPIAYVNIGVVGKNVGTVSDYQGDFKLTVASKFAMDTMRISIIGYKPIDISVRLLEQQLNQDRIIELEEQTLKVPEIIVVDKGLKSKILGNKNATPSMYVGFSTDTLGNEMAIRCKVRRKQTYLKTLKIKIADNPYDSLRFRVNIYDVKNGKPNQLLNKEAIYTQTNIEGGFHAVDLTPFNIVTSKDFFISLEYIEDLTHLRSKDHIGLNFAGSLFGKPVYVRTTSHGTWKKLPGVGIAMNVEVLQ